MDKFKVQITKEYTDEEMEDIMVTALEGGIGYWACLDNTTDDFKDQPEDTPTAVWCWQLLKQGKELRFLDEEDDGAECRLGLPRLLNGIRMATEQGFWDGDIDTLDVIGADAVVQYATFGDIIYG